MRRGRWERKDIPSELDERRLERELALPLADAWDVGKVDLRVSYTLPASVSLSHESLASIQMGEIMNDQEEDVPDPAD